MLIIRGGGDELDLNCYNNYRLAKEVALFPIPVITGIGHSTNDTVVEMVAHHSNITPTDVAYFIIGYFAAFENRIIEAHSGLSFIIDKLLSAENQKINELIRVVKSRSIPFIRHNDGILNTFIISLTKNAQKQLLSSHQQLSASIEKLKSVKKYHFSQANTQLMNVQEYLIKQTAGTLAQSMQYLQLYDEKIAILNPENVLRRGYSITTLNGKIIKDVSLLSNDETISTELATGIIKSKIEKIIPKSNGQ